MNSSYIRDDKNLKRCLYNVDQSNITTSSEVGNNLRPITTKVNNNNLQIKRKVEYINLSTKSSKTTIHVNTKITNRRTT